jgi:DNA topoisomerase-6 subunit B
MASKQRDISVSEFFTKNRHLLGFDNPQKALLTSVKEAVDNSLDACEEAGILPTLKVAIEELSEGRYRVTVEDNGPGIVKAQIPKIFAKLLYGSKFHRLKQSRGQQGIGISAAGMYGQLTTGRPIVITSKTGKGKPAHKMAVRIDARTNAPDVLEDHIVPWDQEHGTSVSIEMAGLYRAGRASVASYLEQTVVANPHLELTFVPPKGESTHWPRASEQLPTETVEIKPHPYGVELGMLIKAFQESGDRTAKAVLMEDFSRVTEPVAVELLRKSGVDPTSRAARMDGASIENVHKVILVSQASIPPVNKLLKMLQKREDKFSTAMLEVGKNLTATLVEELCKRAAIEPTSPAKKVELTQLERFENALARLQVRILPPPATCVAPIGETLIVEGLKRRFKGEFFASHTRTPAVYRGNPFVVEVGIAYGGELPKDESAEVLRFANRVPLLYQPRACATTEAVTNVNWKSYAKDGGINQRGTELPVGPLAVFVHLASVWVPFTNEAKEAIASYDEIIEEIRSALMECGRKLGTYLNALGADRLQRERRSLFEKYIEEVSAAISEITKLGKDRVRKDFLDALPNFVQLDDLPAVKSEPPAALEERPSVPPSSVNESTLTSKNKGTTTDKPAAQSAASSEPKPAAKSASKSAPVVDPVASHPTARATAPAVVKPAASAAVSSPTRMSGEWPARPSASAVSDGGTSWLERELAARIAAKKTATKPVPAATVNAASTASAKTRATAKAPVTTEPAAVARPRAATSATPMATKGAVAPRAPGLASTKTMQPSAVIARATQPSSKLGASKKSASKSKLTPKTKTSAKPTPSGKKGSTKGALTKRKGRR